MGLFSASKRSDKEQRKIAMSLSSISENPENKYTEITTLKRTSDEIAETIRFLNLIKVSIPKTKRTKP